MATVLDIVNKALVAVGVLGRGDTATSEDSSDAIDHLNSIIDECLPFMALGTKELILDTGSTKSKIGFSLNAYSEFQVTRVPVDVLSLHYLSGSDWLPMPLIGSRYASDANASTDAISAPVPWSYHIGNGVGVGSVATCSEIRFQQPLLPCQIRAVISQFCGVLVGADSWDFVGNLSTYIQYRLKAAIAPEYGKDPTVWSIQADQSLSRLRAQNAQIPIASNAGESFDVMNGTDLGFL